MEYRKHLDKNTIIYLVNEITKHHGIKNVPVLKAGRLLYLLWLEYASLYPEYKYPKDSPMNNMTFMNGESGAFEEMFYSHHDEIKKEIMSGNIPTFSQTAFTPLEKIRLERAFDTVRKCFSGYRQRFLCSFITCELPAWGSKRKIHPLELNESERIAEVNAFVKNRNMLIKDLRKDVWVRI